MQRGLADRGGFTLSFPPFTYIIKWLIGINLGVYLLIALLRAGGLYELAAEIFALFQLKPAEVLQGYIWQVATYAFLHADFWHFFFNMLALWMFGSQMEQTWGSRRFLTLYAWGVLGAALFSVVLSYTGALGLNPNIATVGASGGLYAVLIAFGMTFPETEIMMIFPPISIKAKYFAGLLIVLTLISSLQGSGNVAYMAHMGGLIAGIIYVKSMQRGRGQQAPARGYAGKGLSDRAWTAPPPRKPGMLDRMRDN